MSILPNLTQALLPHRCSNRWRGVVLGAVGGAAGTLAMELYFRALSALASAEDQPSSD